MLKLLAAFLAKQEGIYFETTTAGNQKIFLVKAKEIFKIIRLPTKEMVAAAMKAPTGDDARDDMVFWYQCMIDEAAGITLEESSKLPSYYDPINYDYVEKA